MLFSYVYIHIKNNKTNETGNYIVVTSSNTVNKNDTKEVEEAVLVKN